MNKKEKEIEKKALISEADFLRLLEKYGQGKATGVTQINHYYDTPERDIFNASGTLRVRRIGETYVLQYKERLSVKGGVTCSAEMSCPMNGIPGSVTVKGKCAEYVGSLTTERYVFPLDKITLFLDKNTYNGITDYEIEIESDDEKNIPDVFDGVAFEKRPKGKYKRFFVSLKKAGLNTENGFPRVDGEEGPEQGDI